jgi:tetratricopeptide (TPR) repeat protein
VLERGRERRPQHGWIVDRSIALHSAQGDYEEAEAEAMRWIGESGDLLRPQRTAYYWLALLAQVRGKLAEAERYWREEMAFNFQRGEGATFLRHAIRLSKMYILLNGDPAGGVRVLENALNRYPLDSILPLNRPYLGDELTTEGLVLAYALAGQPDRGAALLEDYGAEAIAPELRRGARFDLHGASGVVLLAEGKINEAIQELLQWDPSLGRRTYPNQHLGRAYDLAGQPDAAIDYYEKYLNANSIWRLNLDAAYLGSTYERLGQLYEERGDHARAVLYYGKLVDLWDGADAELQPRVETARRAIRALSPIR